MVVACLYSVFVLHILPLGCGENLMARATARIVLAFFLELFLLNTEMMVLGRAVVRGFVYVRAFAVFARVEDWGMGVRM